MMAPTAGTITSQFHQLVGMASGLGTAVGVYHETLAELYAYLRDGDAQEAVEVSRRHVDILHRTMFMGLAEEAPAQD